jgi:RNAse (barnase) inhibitor barstar
MKKQLADAEKSGVYQLTRKPEEVGRAAKETGLAAFRIDLSQVRGKKDFLDRVAEAMDFPEWFGGNLDSLNDCLTDLDWLPVKTGYVLIFENSRHFDDALPVLKAAAEYWKEEGRPFWALFESPGSVNPALPKWPA